MDFILNLADISGYHDVEYRLNPFRWPQAAISVLAITIELEKG
jgi:hypothetical protein